MFLPSYSPLPKSPYHPEQEGCVLGFFWGCPWILGSKALTAPQAAYGVSRK